MQTAVAQKPAKDKTSNSAAAPLHEVKPDPKQELGTEAGIPLFLQRSPSFNSASPPPTQRKLSEDKEIQLSTERNTAYLPTQVLNNEDNHIQLKQVEAAVSSQSVNNAILQTQSVISGSPRHPKEKVHGAAHLVQAKLFGAPFIQRRCAQCDEEDKQRKETTVQPKLSIGAPNDEYEQEADAVANQIMRKPLGKTSTPIQSKSITNASSAVTTLPSQTKCGNCDDSPLIQRKTELPEIPVLEEQNPQGLEQEGQQKKGGVTQPSVEGKEKDSDKGKKTKGSGKGEKVKLPDIEPLPEEEIVPQIQTKQNAGEHSIQGQTNASSGLVGKLASSKGAGSPLANHVRNEMEQRFGTKLDHVRVHNDSNASQLNRDLSAKAFTHGKDIYFNSGEYQPESHGGKHLLASFESGVQKKYNRDVFIVQLRILAERHFDGCAPVLPIVDDELGVHRHFQYAECSTERVRFQHL